MEVGVQLDLSYKQPCEHFEALYKKQNIPVTCVEQLKNHLLGSFDHLKVNM